MTYNEEFLGYKKLLENDLLKKDYFYKGINWTQAIKILIPIVKRECMLYSEIETNETTKNSQYLHNSFFIKKILDKINVLKFLIKAYYVLLNFNFFLFRNKKNTSINFSFDSFDVKYGNKYFNPYIDILNFSEKCTNLYIRNWGKILQTKNSYFKWKEIGKIKFHYINTIAKSIDFDTDFIFPIKAILKDNEYSLLSDKLKNTYTNYLFFKYLLLKTKPQKVNFEESYNPYCFGLIAACKELKIETNEYQHGILGPLHFGYNYILENETQKNFVPDNLHYYTQELIDWTKQEWTFYPNLVSKPYSPSQELWSKFKHLNNSPKKKQLIDKIGAKKVITFGYSGIKVPEWCYSTLQEATNQYFICLRLHPRMFEDNKKEILGIISDYSNIDYEISSTIPLFDLFEITTVYISDFSTSMIDAIPFVRNVISILGDECIPHFKPYIDKQIIELADDEKSLRKLLKLDND